jgi:glucosamine 6-phosphate synthetase-like amidotransferase/phosphosugar isomerase protein
MCGLVYGKRGDKKPIAKSILKRYKNQDHRGKQGFGYVTIANNKIEHFKRFETESEMEKSLLKETASEILFHHRYPTSTPNIADLNHPFRIDNDSFEHRYYFIHNGVISNDKDLKEEHEKLGLEYKSIIETSTKTIKTTIIGDRKSVVEKEEVETKYNDSEALAYEVALFLENKISNLQKPSGTIAFICIQTDKNDNVKKLFYGRNEGNPLIIERDTNSKMFFLKSEGTGFKMDAHEIVSVEAITGEVELQYAEIGKPKYTWNPNPATTRSYGYNTPTKKDDEEEISYEYDSTTDEAILESIAEQVENELEELMDEEEFRIEELKDARQRLYKSIDKYEIWEVEQEIFDLEGELNEVRSKIERKKRDLEDLGMLEQDEKQPKLLKDVVL